MIYNNNIATFNYPVYSNDSNAYLNPSIYLNFLTISQNEADYDFDYQIEIDSEFIANLIKQECVSLMLVFQTKDSMFYLVNDLIGRLTIPKREIAFTDTIKTQVLLVAKKSFDFTHCHELQSAYQDIKSEIDIPIHNIVGYSDLVTIDSNESADIKLFTFQIDSEMVEPFKVDVNYQNIRLFFRESKFSLHHLTRNKNIQNMYIYYGLSVGISRLIDKLLVEGESVDEDEIDLNTVDETNLTGLETNLVTLMRNQNVDFLSRGNLDSVIHRITSGIIEKFVNDIEEVVVHGN